MVAINVSEHLWVLLGWNIPSFISAGLASSPRGPAFPLGAALVQWPGARPVHGKEHKAANVTDLLLNFTILFGWELSPFLRFHLPNFVQRCGHEVTV